MTARFTWCSYWLPAAMLLGCVDKGTDAAATHAKARDAGNSADAAVAPASGARRLSSTGLFTDIASAEIAPDVHEYTPQGVLWSDGADKKRWVYLPEGTQIDSKDMDDWRFPVGTKLWKEFDVEGQRIETRLLEKTAARTWKMVAFAWADDQSDAVEVADGVDNALGTEHDIPRSEDCLRCHRGVLDSVIGFSAVQLSHSDSALTLSDLASEGRLTAPPSAALTVPGDSEQHDALLYLHANCANCHNQHTIISNATGIDFWLRAEHLSTLQDTRTYQTLQRDLEVSKSVDASATLRRMSVRGVEEQMPPIASEIVDERGVSLVEALLRSIDAHH